MITAEGGIDYQTAFEKVSSYIAHKAQSHNVLVTVLARTFGGSASLNYSHGVDAFAGIMQSPMPLERAIAEAQRLLSDAAELTMRTVMIGCNVC